MSRSDMQILAPDRRKHGRELFDLLGKTFSGRGYFEFRDYCRDTYVHHSHYDWETSRIGLVDGRIVAHFGIWDYQMRIGTARVRTGGIGAVATHGDYRRRGLMRRLIPAALDAMRAAGYDMSVLFGIHDFYHKFGYVRAWPSTAHVVRLADLPGEPPAVRLRKFAVRARKDLTALYNRQYAAVTGTAVRPTYQKSRRPGQWQGFGWAGRSGRLAGYLLAGCHRGRLSCPEACGDAGQVLRAAAALARKRSCYEVRFDPLPYDGPLARRIRRGTCRVESHYVKGGGPMVRTVNLPRVLEKMAGELWRRLRGSPLAGWRGRLLVADAEAKGVLSVGPSGVRLSAGGTSRHAIRGGYEIAQLLLGTDEPAEIVQAARIRLSGDARKLLPVLFPNQHPMLSPWDSF